MLERTLSILKPDAIREGQVEQINKYITNAGLKIIASKDIMLTREQAEKFYEIHKDRPFFDSLISFMISGPVRVQVLEHKSAISKYRDLMGATDPSKAAKGTLRADFASSIEENRVHGSDSAENAVHEISFFFPDLV